LLSFTYIFWLRSLYSLVDLSAKKRAHIFSSPNTGTIPFTPKKGIKHENDQRIAENSWNPPVIGRYIRKWRPRLDVICVFNRPAGNRGFGRLMLYLLGFFRL
jgi:hypothetical protein